MLEAHVLSCLPPELEHLILIGDPRQLRPKLEHFPLSVEAPHTAHDFNVSLFERLVSAGTVPAGMLRLQHRMRPAISAIVRELSYPALQDAETTRHRAHIKGLAADVVFVDHNYPESGGGNSRGGGVAAVKQNVHEARMVAATVVYLMQQGYKTSEITVLTP